MIDHSIDCFYLKDDACRELKVSYRCLSSHWFCFPIQFFSPLSHLDQYLFSGHTWPLWPPISAVTYRGKLSITRKLWQHCSVHMRSHVQSATAPPQPEVFSFTTQDVCRAWGCSRETTRDKQPAGWRLTWYSAFVSFFSFCLSDSLCLFSLFLYLYFCLSLIFLLLLFLSSVCRFVFSLRLLIIMSLFVFFFLFFHLLVNPSWSFLSTVFTFLLNLILIISFVTFPVFHCL